MPSPTTTHMLALLISHSKALFESLHVLFSLSLSLSLFIYLFFLTNHLVVDLSSSPLFFFSHKSFGSKPFFFLFFIRIESDRIGAILASFLASFSRFRRISTGFSPNRCELTTIKEKEKRRDESACRNKMSAGAAALESQWF